MFKLSSADVKIFEALACYGPRNITEISRKIAVPAETLRKKIKRIRAQFFLKFNINVYHTNLGLKKAVVFAESLPGYEEVLFNALKINNFWIFLSRCYGMFDGCVGIFTIPKESCPLFESYINQLERLGIAKNSRIYWSTCFHYVPINSQYFDQSTETWILDWDGWLKEIENAKPELPYTLMDPKDFPMMADEIDLFILKELEKDATVTFRMLANKLNISSQLVRYHYYNHVIDKGLLESFEITVFYFGKDSEFYLFIFSFDDWEKLAKFASSLLNKPFVRTLGKILGKNELYVYFYLPKQEFRKLRDALSKLIRRNFLKSYEYVIQDLSSSLRATIPFECFKNGKWVYDHNKYLEQLQKLINESAPELIKINVL
jgi:DNA-binding Lrp family transcriptional regulator